MRLIRVLRQHRHDFQGVYQCEFCGHQSVDQGMTSYDDTNYHQNVIPHMICPRCRKRTAPKQSPLKETRHE